MREKCFKLLVLMLAAAGLLQAAPPRVVLVFPLENLSGQSNLGWMSEGIADLLGSRLVAPSRYVLSREERNSAYEEMGLSPDVPLTLASEYEVAQTLGADFAVVGNFTVKNKALTLQVQWLDVHKLQLSPWVAVSGELGDLARLETRLAWSLVRRYDPGEATGSEVEFSHRFRPVRLDAFENYIRGVLATDSKSKIHFLRESELLDPSNHRPAFQLGRYYFEKKDYSNSARWLQVLKPSDSDYSESLFLLGIDQHELGYDGLAEKAFKQLAQRVQLGAVMNNLGVVDLGLNHQDQALQIFQNAYEKDPSNPDLLYNLGVCYWRQQKYKQAGQYLEKALAQSPDDSAVRTLAAHVKEKLEGSGAGKQPLQDPPKDGKSSQDTAGDHQAGAAFNPAPRIIAKYNGRAFRLAAVTTWRANEEQLAQQSPEVVRREAMDRLKRGRGLLAAGKLREAEQQLAVAAALLPANSGAHLALGEVYQREGKHTLAAAELDASLHQKDSIDARLWLAKAYLSLQHPGAAQAQAEAALRIDPSNAEAEALLRRIQKLASAKRGAH